jgi:amino acid transporter
MFESQTIPQFISGRIRARRVVILFWVTIGLSLVSLLSNSSQVQLLRRIEAREAFTQDEATANDRRQQLIAIAEVAALVATVVTFLMWMHRAYKNLPALGSSGLRTTPGWAVGSFFIPFLNLVRPYQAMAEIWRESDPGVAGEERALNPRGGAALVGWWWLLFLAHNVASNVSARFVPGAHATVADFIAMTNVKIFSDLVDIPAALLALLMVRALDARQEKKALRGAVVAEVFS